MEFLAHLLDIFLHIDKHLLDIINTYQTWTYLFVFLIIFAETGFVVTPFLPGDSVLFALGALLARPESSLSVTLFWGIILLSAISGDFVNYECGKYFGNRLFTPDAKFFKKEYVDKTQRFYEQYGTKTIVYARFVPIVRTFAPFIAGVGKMSYRVFGQYNILGGFMWVTIFLFSGYFFGQIPFIQKHFSVIVVVIVLLSATPMLIQLLYKKPEK